MSHPRSVEMYQKDERARDLLRERESWHHQGYAIVVERVRREGRTSSPASRKQHKGDGVERRLVLAAKGLLGRAFAGVVEETYECGSWID